MHSGHFCFRRCFFKPRRTPRTGVATERAETPRSVQTPRTEADAIFPRCPHSRGHSRCYLQRQPFQCKNSLFRFPALAPRAWRCHFTKSQGSHRHPSFLANGGNLCYKPSDIPNGEPAESSISNMADTGDCRWHSKRQKKKALAIPLLFLPRSSMSAGLMAPVLAAWNLIACEDIREAYGHNKYTYTYTCVYTHTPRYVSTNTHSGM